MKNYCLVIICINKPFNCVIRLITIMIQVRIRRLATRSQNRVWESGRKVIVRCLDLWRKGIRKRMRTEAARASTPPSLLGMERRMA